MRHNGGVTERTAYRFIGRGDEFVQGVPQRSLSADEFYALSPEQKDLLERNVDGPAPLFERIQVPATETAMSPVELQEAPESPKRRSTRQRVAQRQGEASE